MTQEIADVLIGHGKTIDDATSSLVDELAICAGARAMEARWAGCYSRQPAPTANHLPSFRSTWMAAMVVDIDKVDQFVDLMVPSDHDADDLHDF